MRSQYNLRPMYRKSCMGRCYGLRSGFNIKMHDQVEKHQSPTSNIQRISKNQIPNVYARENAFGAWSFSGCWSLEVGGSPLTRSRLRQYLRSLFMVLLRRKLIGLI